MAVRPSAAVSPLEELEDGKGIRPSEAASQGTTGIGGIGLLNTTDLATGTTGTFQDNTQEDKSHLESANLGEGIVVKPQFS